MSNNQVIPKVDDVHSQRFKVALEIFSEGLPLNYKDIFIKKSGDHIS